MLKLLSLLLALPLIPTTLAKDSACTLRNGDGYFDLNPLSASKDYSIPSDTKDGNPIYLNVCRGVTSETWNLDEPKNVGGFVRKAHGDFSLGQVNTTLYSAPSGSIHMYMLGGSKCTTGAEATTVIDFVCDTSVFGAGSPTLMGKLPPGSEEACSFFVEWKTHFACPTGSRSGPWGFFVGIILLFIIFLMLYITLGTLYNRFVLNLRGFDQLPSFSVEGFRYHAAEALDWFRDLMGGMYEGGQGGRYNVLPRTNPVSHQSSVPGGTTDDFARLGSNSLQRMGTPRGPLNPVSHQSQVAAQAQPQSPTPPRLETPQPSTPAPPAKEEERPFSVGDDDDEEAASAHGLVSAPETTIKPSAPSSEIPH
ncbi:mannose 6-phosphate receptor domain-containing protein [Cylindrobasidium torrendii FP15055 ss-10]|uniref:Autophagy-related protein 27 n=1 Tax=Cylindrobasidium torrendii FP15055 ss-10 TaxID=1314674 RepID=A0A0D7BTY0_9AGAR|nr:mannose 6-phosphate receptor domain-containing protein [Cylindrobasidium torrendii FP15055 ss-10]